MEYVRNEYHNVKKGGKVDYRVSPAQTKGNHSLLTWVRIFICAPN